ncbi:hypothetical protein [Bradyrhizobium sp. NP1]|uniref:hypothetical protein n=1 Tax=Bradyrhizobium sp. NP1 TaxID=3049772 RepID=UPI0025A5BB1D|nr:hypothetical protein [Bradyrhizobium sp. NP1]WJR76479.1 hypothetical protein QOU61_27500 [Bradyrhizobium sp. NP1]
MMIDAGLIDLANPDAPPAGGLPGMILEYMRNNYSLDREPVPTGRVHLLQSPAAQTLRGDEKCLPFFSLSA